MSKAEDYSIKETGLIKRDLKRLKRWRSLGVDIKNVIKITIGYLTDNVVSAASCTSKTVFGNHITETVADGQKISFYKKRVPITNPKTCPSAGARLVYGYIEGKNSFIPILIYAVSEEGEYYEINNRKIPLTVSGLIEIINEKLSSL